MLNFIANAITFVCIGFFFGGLGVIWGSLLGAPGAIVGGLVCFVFFGWLGVKIASGIGAAIGRAIWGDPQDQHSKRYV